MQEESKVPVVMRGQTETVRQTTTPVLFVQREFYPQSYSLTERGSGSTGTTWGMIETLKPVGCLGLSTQVSNVAVTSHHSLQQHDASRWWHSKCQKGHKLVPDSPDLAHVKGMTLIDVILSDAFHPINAYHATHNMPT